MKIIVDAFGGDNAPLEILKGCEMAVKELDIDILLTGQEAVIRKVAAENGISLDRMEIAEAPDVITMDDSPKSIMKEKSQCSLAEGLRRLAAGDGDAFVSSGNSGALVFGANMIVKRIRGVKRVAFAPVLPKDEGFFMLIDGGANVECRPEMLQQFGMMGAAYMEHVMGVPNPRVALANVGTEDHKGGELQLESFALLQKSPVNFIGNIEARDIPVDAGDVIVCDGFTGNVILKLYEGVAMVLGDMKVLKKQMDYNEYGGAPIMGAAKPVFKAHGSAKAQTFKNALRLTKAYVEGDVVRKITESLQTMKGEGEQA